MAVSLPAAVNLHDLNPLNDPLARSNIGGVAPGTKTRGNLPLTSNAAQISHNNTSGGGWGWDIPTAFDSSVNTKLFIWGSQFNAPNRIQSQSVANRGIFCRIYSGTGDNYIEFNLGGNDTPYASAQSGVAPFVFDPQATGFTATAGTFDPTDVTGYAWGNTYRQLPTGNTPTSLVFWCRMLIIGTEKDAADIPKFTGLSSFDDLIELVQGSDFSNKIHNFATRSGNSYTLACPFQIGDGATATDFNDSGSTVLSPEDNDPNDPRFQLSDQAMRVHLSLTAADTVTITGNYTWGTPAAWDFNSSVGATVTLDDAIFNNMGEFTVGSDVTLNGTVFNLNSSAVVDTGADLSGVTVNGELRLTTVRDVDSANADKLVATQAGSYDLTNCLLGEFENTSGGVINLTSDRAIPLITNTGVGSVTNLQDGAFSFSSNIDAWTIYPTQADADANTNALGTGGPNDTFSFAFNGTDTYYFRLTVVGETVFQESTPLAAGTTLIDLGATALLIAIDGKLNPSISIG